MTLSSSREVGRDRKAAPFREDPRSDAELLQASGTDPAAFSILYRRWAKQMLAYFYRRTWDGEAAADLTAETFAVAFAKRSRFIRSAAPGGAWLYGIAANELKRYRRRHRTEKRALRRLGVETPPMDDVSLQRIEDLDEIASFRSQLKDALSNLSSAEQEAVQLRIVDELPFRDVARRLGCSEGAARVRVHRALNRLSIAMGATRDE